MSELDELYVIEAKLKYGELPLNFREGFLGYGWQDLNGNPIHLLDDYGIGANEMARLYVSANARLKKKGDFLKISIIVHCL